jgi:hypothetical protein
MSGILKIERLLIPASTTDKSHQGRAGFHEGVMYSHSTARAAHRDDVVGRMDLHGSS